MSEDGTVFGDSVEPASTAGWPAWASFKCKCGGRCRLDHVIRLSSERGVSPLAFYRCIECGTQYVEEPRLF